VSCTVCSAGANLAPSPKSRLQHHRNEGNVLPKQPLREHWPDPDQPGIFGIILSVVESRVSQLHYLAMRPIHSWLDALSADQS
jgi:hypothetical protein